MFTQSFHCLLNLDRLSLNEVCFLNIVNDVRDGGLVVLSTFTSSSSLLDQGHILYNKKESYKIW